MTYKDFQLDLQRVNTIQKKMTMCKNMKGCRIKKPGFVLQAKEQVYLEIFDAHLRHFISKYMFDVRTVIS